MRRDCRDSIRDALLATVVVACGLSPALATAGADEGAAGCAPGSADRGFAERLGDAYRTHFAWNGGEPSAPAPRVVDGAEVPVSNPPWPYATWNIGGTNAIGVDNLYSSAVMDALYCGRGGQALKDSRLTVYGWLEAGGNLSTSHSRYNYATGSGGNAPAAYTFQPNTVQLDQFALYLERTPNVVQRDHFDWGGRLTLLYGADYKYTFSNGVFSNQYLDRGRAYGFDPVMYYLDFWFPKVAQGMNVRVGRYISIPDIEAQLAPNNISYTHSLLYTVDPYTQHGVVATVKLDRHWQVQGSLHAGNDVGPWVKSERKLTPAACVMWTSDSGRDALYPCMNGLNDGRWRWDNVQHAVLTWYHKFDARWHMDTEIYYLWQSDTPNVNNAAGLARLAGTYNYVTYGAPGGAHCEPSLASCYSYAYAAVNYVNYTIGPRDLLTFRSDYLNDARGQRTGYRTRYYEFDLSYTHWLGDVVELRPELRFEHAREAPAYDNPAASLGAGRHSQFMIAADAIVHF